MGTPEIRGSAIMERVARGRQETMNVVQKHLSFWFAHSIMRERDYDPLRIDSREDAKRPIASGMGIP